MYDQWNQTKKTTLKFRFPFLKTHKSRAKFAAKQKYKNTIMPPSDAKNGKKNHTYLSYTRK